ncbi:MAG: hypothetical protein OXT69_13685 [Candidatus Poribacteria bacterium]|nr:hypothetical protein [Candidatus Poribacteria bacterium]
MYPPPRVSRLHKAALTLLVAATAAFFVCAPASAIQITSIWPSSGSYSNPVHVFEDMDNQFTITTDADFERVEWELIRQWWSPFLEKKNDPGTKNGTDTRSHYSPALGGMGAPYGNRHYIKVTAFDANGASDSEAIYLMVWRRSNLPNQILNMSAPDNVLAGESFEAEVETLTLYSRVEWYIKRSGWFLAPQAERVYGNPVDVTRGRGLKASFPHTFQSDRTDRDRLSKTGSKYYILARAFSLLDPDAEPVEDKIAIHVHEGKKRRAISGHSHIYYAHIDPATWVSTVDWIHELTYYNEIEGAEAHLYAWAKLFEVSEENDDDEQEVAVFRSGDTENGVGRNDLVLNLDVTFEGRVYEFFNSKPLKIGDEPFRLIAGVKYRFKAHQFLGHQGGEVWRERQNGNYTFTSQTRRFDPRDEFDDGGLEWEKGLNGVDEE